MTTLRWTRVRAGVYEAQDGDTLFRIVFDFDGGWRENGAWMCYANGYLFDTADTLREAKTYCRAEV